MPAPLFTGGYGPVASIVNYFSSGGTSFTTGNLNASALGSGREYLSGAATANTLVTVLNVSGRGRLNYLAAYCKDTTSRTVRCQVVIDGTTVFDATSNTLTTLGGGIVPVGVVDTTGAVQQFGQITYYQSLVVKIATSNTETDKIAAVAHYETWA